VVLLLATAAAVVPSVLAPAAAPEAAAEARLPLADVPPPAPPTSVPACVAGDSSEGAGVACGASEAADTGEAVAGVAGGGGGAGASSEPELSVAGGSVGVALNRPGVKVAGVPGVLYADAPSRPAPSAPGVSGATVAWAADAEQMHTVLHAPEFMRCARRRSSARSTASR
jgi:hypothetical protein